MTHAKRRLNATYKLHPDRTQAIPDGSHWLKLKGIPHKGQFEAHMRRENSGTKFTIYRKHREVVGVGSITHGDSHISFPFRRDIHSDTKAAIRQALSPIIDRVQRGEQ